MSSSKWSYRPHQLNFIQTELKFPYSPGRIIDHDLGSGKTLTVIGAIEALRVHKEFKNAPVIVLTMKALVEGFKNELEKSINLQDTRIDLYQVTTYQKFYMHPDQFKFEGGILVIDEAHTLRNPNGKKYQAIFQTAQKVRKTYLLSGTITINYTVDYAPMFNLILADEKRPSFEPYIKKPGYLPISRKKWQDYFGDFKLIKPYTKCLVSLHREDHVSADYKAHFPTVERHEVKLRMSKEHYNLYKARMREDIYSAKQKERKQDDENSAHATTAQDISDFQKRISEGPKLTDTKDFKFLAYIMKLRMACNYIKGEDDEEHFPKIAHAVRRIVTSYLRDKDYKATITTTFINSGIRIIQQVLRVMKVPFVTITGQVEDVKNEKDIQDKVNLYNSNTVRVMLFSSAGTHGLDLHGTTESFIIDPHWNKPHHRQTEARVIRFDSHRNSKNKTVKIFYYTMMFPEDHKGTGGTADEYLVKLATLKDEENKKMALLISQNCIETTEPIYLYTTMSLFDRPAWSHATSVKSKKRTHNETVINPDTNPSKRARNF